jgi:hypothetical protein
MSYSHLEAARCNWERFAAQPRAKQHRRKEHYLTTKKNKKKKNTQLYAASRMAGTARRLDRTKPFGRTKARNATSHVTLRLVAVLVLQFWRLVLCER